MTNETILGTPSITTDADKTAAARRELVQACFHEYAPQKTAVLMEANNISVNEMVMAMDHKLDVVAWMRRNNYKDGFQGLKVWPQSEVDLFYTWHDAQGTTNALGLPIARPDFAVVQAIMDREFAAHKALPEHQIPWHVK